jgi:DNA-binding helix-hairpin-helix protein with protein kinase domain
MLQHEEATRIHLSFDADGTFQQVFESMSAEEQQPHAQSWIDGLDQVRQSHFMLLICR